MRFCPPAGEKHDSDLLASLVTPGRCFPDMAAALADLEAATDWEEAEANGRVIPRQVPALYTPLNPAPKLGGYHIHGFWPRTQRPAMAQLVMEARAHSSNN